MSLNPAFLNSFNISVDESREPATYIELLVTYNTLFENHKKLENQVKEKDEELSTLRNKLKSMEKMLQDEIEESDKMKEMGERERLELNQKNRDLEQDLVMKENQIFLLKKQLAEDNDNEETVIAKGDTVTAVVEGYAVAPLIESLVTEQLKNDNKNLEEMIEQSGEKMKELDKTLLDREAELSTSRAQYQELALSYKNKIKETEEELMSKANTLRERNSVIMKLEHDLKRANDQIRLLEVSLGDYLDENVRCKNENKVYQKRLKDMEDNNEHTTNNGEVFKLKEDLNKFKSYVSKEISDLKVKAGNASQNSKSKCILNSENRFKPLQFNVNGVERDESSTDYSSDADVDTPPTPRTRIRRRRRRAKKLAIVPGMGTYSQALTGEKKNVVFSTSLTRDIEVNAFNRSCKEGNKTNFIRFRGKKICHIKNYIATHLNEEHPDTVIILGGGNDLPETRMEQSPVARVAQDIMEAGRLCKQNGVNTVAISSIPPRESFHFQLYRKELNDLLRVQCLSDGFHFIDNKNIILKEHILRDGVHLNLHGTELLRTNFLNFLNSMG